MEDLRSVDGWPGVRGTDGEEEVLTGSKDTNSISKIIVHDVWEPKGCRGLHGFQ